MSWGRLNLRGGFEIASEIGRKDIKPGWCVKVVQKQDQRSGKLTEGIVKDLLTKAPFHPHGIKVRLEGGIVGRVKEIVRKTSD